MHRLRFSFSALSGLVLATTVVAGSAWANNSRLTLDQAIASGWGCEPLILIGGHFHCSPPGKQSVVEIIAGTADSSSIVHTVFDAGGQFAGTELLIRADLFAGQPCPTDVWLPVPPWLPEPTYYACHHFAFTP